MMESQRTSMVVIGHVYLAREVILSGSVWGDCQSASRDCCNLSREFLGGSDELLEGAGLKKLNPTVFTVGFIFFGARERTRTFTSLRDTRT